MVRQPEPVAGLDVLDAFQLFAALNVVGMVGEAVANGIAVEVVAELGLAVVAVAFQLLAVLASLAIVRQLAAVGLDVVACSTRSQARRAGSRSARCAFGSPASTRRKLAAPGPTRTQRRDRTVSEL